MREGNRKRTLISLSSSSSSDDEGDADDRNYIVSDSSRHSSDGFDSSDDEYVTEESDVYEESDDEDDAQNVNDDGDDDSLCDRVTRLLQEGRDLEGLNVKECKAYLRRHELRISGTKAECIKRIQEHWRIRDRNVEALYPRSSFVINCTGDVCKGDVVLFTQKVYKQFDKMTRRGNLQGKRTIAGRVVKESYGAAKQQHTFTVEVLWSKGIQALPSLFPLLVKGRNLYKSKTFRQRWSNEAERSKVLDEKHKRGAAARLVRAMRKTEKIRSTDRGVKRQKHFHDTKSSRTRKTNEGKKGKHVRQGKATSHRISKTNFHKDTPSFRQVNQDQNARFIAYESSRHLNHYSLNRDRVSTRQSLTDPPQNPHLSRTRFHHQSALRHISNYDLASTSATTRLPPFTPYAGASYMPPPSLHQLFDLGHQTFSDPSYDFEFRSSYMNVGRPMHQFPSRNYMFGHRNY